MSDLDTPQQFAESCARILGEALVSILLHGSLVLGDYQPGRSDIDLLVIVDRPLSDQEIHDLVEVTLSKARESTGGLDMRVVTRAVAAHASPAPSMELYVGVHRNRTPEIETRVTSERDLLVELSLAREHGRTLVGASARDVIAEIPERWILEYGDDILSRWEGLADDEEHLELMVLTACRIWRFSVEGHYSSKADAGRWALEQDPLVAIAAALSRRSGRPDVRTEAREVARLISVVRDRIASRLSCSSPA